MTGLTRRLLSYFKLMLFVAARRVALWRVALYRKHKTNCPRAKQTGKFKTFQYYD